MTTARTCGYCHIEFVNDERVIFSHRETFTFKPANVPDVVNAAKVTVAELAESRKEHQRTAVVNTFCSWGKAIPPEGAFNFRHSWCEPQRTGAGMSGVHPASKHAVRFTRSMVKRSHS